MEKIKPGLEALRELRRVVEAAPPEKFNMKFFWDIDCGCAIGHAAKDSRFQEIGFRLLPNNDGTWSPHSNSAQGFYAITEVFELSIETAFNLFLPGSYQDGSRKGEPAKVECLSRIDAEITKKELKL